MAEVYLGRMTTGGQFSRLVAIKQLHPHLATDSVEIAMLLDEARLSARVRHVNVVAMLDVVRSTRGVSLVMEYVEGASLQSLLEHCRREATSVPIGIAIAIAADMLRGLAACHDATTDRGEPLQIVHRDVSPQNVLVGVDGVARIADLGVARGTGRMVATERGVVKGKLRYMAPEQLEGRALSRQVDVFAAGAVLWEMLAGRPLVDASDDAAALGQILSGRFHPPSTFRSEVSPELDAIVLRSLGRDLAERYGTASEMATALRAHEAGSIDEVAAFVRDVGRERLREQQTWVRASPEDDDFRSLEDVLAELDRGTAPEPPTRVADTVPVDVVALPSSASARVVEPSPKRSMPAARRPPPKPLYLRAALVIGGALLAVGVGLLVRGSEPPAEPLVATPTAPEPLTTEAIVPATPPPSPPSPSVREESAAPDADATRPDPPRATPQSERSQTNGRPPAHATVASPARHPVPRASADARAGVEDPRSRL
jgi:serine/threonine-protein kinase